MDEEYRPETVYKVETTNRCDANLMINANRMAGALYEILNWRSSLYNGKDYGDYQVLYKGNLYSESEFHKLEKDKEDLNEYGLVKSDKIKEVYTREMILRRLDESLDDISDLIYHYFE